MIIVIQFLVIILIIAIISTLSLVCIDLMTKKNIKDAMNGVNGVLRKKQDAVIFDDEPKTEEEEAIEREERILKVVRGEK